MRDLSDEKEQIILKAARDVFLEKGKQGARMEEIARRAGINKALLHYYFRSKERLYQRVFEEEVFHFFRDFLETIPRQGDYRTFLEQFVHNYWHRISAAPQPVRFILWEIQQGGEVLTQIFHRLFKGDPVQNNPFLQRTREAIANGEIRPVDPFHLFLNVVGMCIYPVIAAPLLEKVFPDFSLNNRQFRAAREKEIISLLWEGLEPQTIND